MNLTNLTDARSMAAVVRIEKDRCWWLSVYGARCPDEQRALSQAYYDEQSSKALTQSLADKVCRELEDGHQ